MAVVVPGPPVLSSDLALFHTTDPLLANLPVLVFHGPAATIGATSSRIQVHVFTAAGHQSYARLAVSPNSPFYSAVSNLPREEQGDEVCRGLAFGLKKYFTELPGAVKTTWCTESKAALPSALFGDEHVAILATRMTKVENSEQVGGILQKAFGELRMSWMDVDVVLPPGSIKNPQHAADHAEDLDEGQLLHHRFGKYAELVASLGDTAFLPTSKMKRAPSKATPLGRTASFLRHQKEKVRKELQELFETETSYVQRISELSEISQTLGADLDSVAQVRLRSMFPSSIKTIARLNASFLQSLQSVFESTESRAIKDILEMEDDQPTTTQAWQDRTEDTQGIGAIAACLCEWLPRFQDSYGEYLKSQAECAQLLRDSLRGAEAALAAALLSVGEQRLTSLLIEPVQRLPRYTLYIDTISKQLPVGHLAIKQLLRARDMVTGICDRNGLDLSAGKIVQTLGSRISSWPQDEAISGRLITACDYVEIVSQGSLQPEDGAQGMMLLFTDGLVFLGKSGSTLTSARSLLTELEAGHLMPKPAQSRPQTPPDLTFLQFVPLHAVNCLEGMSGHTIQLLMRTSSATSAPGLERTKSVSCRTLRLEGLYERKVEKLVEEITKARIEGRFSEAERESPTWELRASDPSADAASLLSAIFDDASFAHVRARQGMAPIRLVVDIDRHAQKYRAGKDGIRTIVCATHQRDGLWRLTFDSIDGNVNHEQVKVLEVVPTIRKRLASLVDATFSIEQCDMTACLLAKNAEILRSIDVKTPEEEVSLERQTSVREKVSRPKSPKKFLSSFLSSTGPEPQPPTILKKELPPLPRPAGSTRYTIAPPSKPPSRESRPASRDQPTPKSSSSVFSADCSGSQIGKLEETLSAYTLALQARKGNIVGRSLTMRSAANELAVNELYNSLLEDPNAMTLAAQATVDVLFSAFEKFLAIAWTDQIGQVLPLPLLEQIRAKAETAFPSEFDQYFRSSLECLPPQNQRAFKHVMKLLADLLDGTGNDSDRGILTAAFAEVLVPEGDARDYIALIDRFVDDPDTYFGEPLEDVQKVSDGTTGMHKRSRSVNSASITSNTSSLRRKLGFGGSSKENAKPEQESKVASVWRTLSKSARGDASPGNSVSRGHLIRAHSNDAEGRLLPSRPTSQDGSIHKPSGMADDASFVSISSAQNLGLSTIGEHPSLIPTQPPRKKRRSSLSDLQALDDLTQKSPLWSSPTASRPAAPNSHIRDKSLPGSPQCFTPSSKGDSGRHGMASRQLSRPQLPPSFRRENSPSPLKCTATAELGPRNAAAVASEALNTGKSNIPTLMPKTGSPTKDSALLPGRGGGLFERRDAGNAVKKLSPSPERETKPTTFGTTENGSPKKLRMQSPQKLRQRLYNEQTALTATQTSLQHELSKLGEEISSTPSRMGSIRNTGLPSLRAHMSDIDLAARLLKLEGQLTQQIEELQSRMSSVQSDLASSLTVSETKCKKLDALYREANGENEALYTRFNDELGRVLKVVRGGEGVEELKQKLKESQEDVIKLKRENGRLKRENVGLKSQLKD